MRQKANRGGARGQAGMRDHYAEVTNQVITALETGVPPWRRPWDSAKAQGPMMPHNAATGQHYRGINVVTLTMSPLALMSGDPRFATYKQAAERGWQIRKGSRGTPGFFYKRIELRDHDDTEQDGETEGSRWIPLLRAFTLFHASQIDGIPPYVLPGRDKAPWREPEASAIIARNSKAVIHTGGVRAFYSPVTDHVQMPPLAAFRSPSAYASVLLHELGHWSGSVARLKRNLSGSFGSAEYSREELRVELAQMMVCAELDITDCDWTNGAAYIAHWVQILRDEKREIFRAASDAQRIADYLLAFHPEYAARVMNVGTTESDSGLADEASSDTALAEAA